MPRGEKVSEITVKMIGNMGVSMIKRVDNNLTNDREVQDSEKTRKMDSVFQ